jgi:hypothetical protein
MLGVIGRGVIAEGFKSADKRELVTFAVLTLETVDASFLVEGELAACDFIE